MIETIQNYSGNEEINFFEDGDFDFELYNDNFLDLGEPEHKEEWLEVRDQMFVHTRGVVPEEMLLKRRPNEDPEVFQYRVDIYEPITNGSMNKAIDKLYRIFQAANFSIQVSEELNLYLADHRFYNSYFYTYIQKYVVRKMIEDPNALLAWLPVGEGLIDPTQKVDVEPVLIGSEQIIYLSDDVVTWIDDQHYSIVTAAGKDQRTGEIYHTLTNESYYQHKQYGEKGDKRFEVVKIYDHGLRVKPTIVLGGNITADYYFDSFFSPFLPFGNEAIRQYSDWQGVMTTSAFPYREEQSQDCDFKGCRDGVVYDNESDDYNNCPKCQGTGQILNRSPYGVFLRAKSNNALDQNEDTAPLVRFISPPVDIIKYSGEAWKDLLRQAEDALHLNFVDEAQSGVAKSIDREDSYSFLTKISNNIFDEIIYKSLKYIEEYRNVNDPVDPNIVKPISFEMKNEDDLINEINQLQDKNAPVAFLVESTKDLARKRFSGNKSVARIVEILVAYDPIYHIKTADKAVLLASGVIKQADMIKSLFAYKTLTEILSFEGNDYLEKELTAIFADLDQKIAPVIKAQESNPVIDPNQVNFNEEL